MTRHLPVVMIAGVLALAGCGRTPDPRERGDADLGELLNVSGEGSAAITVEAPGRFRLVFEETHAWQATQWNDVAFGNVNLAGDPAAFDRQVLQQPILFKATSRWSLLTHVEGATVTLQRRDEATIELFTELAWRTEDGDLLPGSVRHTIRSDGTWAVRATLTNARTTQIGNAIEYADTHVRAVIGWDETRAIDETAFSFTAAGSGPRPRIEVRRSDPTMGGTIRQDEAGNLYWGSFQYNLQPGETWAREWTNRIWPPAES